MNDTTQTLIRAILKIGAGYLAAKGMANDSQIQEISAGLMAIIAVIWGICHRSGPANSGGTQLRLLFFLGALPLLTLTGCTSTVNSGHVVSVTDRFIGLHYSQQTQNPTSPDVVFGFGSSTVVVMPTVTNQTLSVPAIANTFSMAQQAAGGGIFMLPVVDETFASANYATGSATNGQQAIPVVPSPIGK